MISHLTEFRHRGSSGFTPGCPCRECESDFWQSYDPSVVENWHGKAVQIY